MTTDEKITNTIRTTIETLKIFEIDYLLFGSCGIQSYFPNFFRLPNDIDLVLRQKDISLFLQICHEKKLRVIDEPGRFKVYIDDFPIHVIPENFSIINKEDASTIARISFERAFEGISQNALKLLYSDTEITVNAMPLEYSLFMELVRKQNTNSFYSIMALLSIKDISLEKALLLITEYPNLQGRVEQSLAALDRITKMPLAAFEFPSSACIHAIASLRALIKNHQGNQS